MNQVKPGWKTTEFWLTALASLIGLLFASDLIPTDGTAMKLLGLVATALSTMGYSISRGKAKQASQTAPTVLPLILCMGLALPVLSGCSTVETAAYRTLGTIAATVDHSMNAWGDYVRAGYATADEETKVKAAYEKYQACMRTARATVNGYLAAKTDPASSEWDLTLAAVEGAAGDLTQLIASFTKRK